MVSTTHYSYLDKYKKLFIRPAGTITSYERHNSNTIWKVFSGQQSQPKLKYTTTSTSALVWIYTEMTLPTNQLNHTPDSPTHWTHTNSALASRSLISVWNK